jgi:hypothetical protein
MTSMPGATAPDHPSTTEQPPAAVTCISCGAALGSPHSPGCAFETLAGAA